MYAKNFKWSKVLLAVDQKPTHEFDVKVVGTFEIRKILVGRVFKVSVLACSMSYWCVFRWC